VFLNEILSERILVLACFPSKGFRSNLKLRFLFVNLGSDGYQDYPQSYYYDYQNGYDQSQDYYPDYFQPSYQKHHSYPMALPSTLSYQSHNPPKNHSKTYSESSPSTQYSSKSVSGKKENSILIASGFPEDVTPYKIFRFFSLYGNVARVKIMFKKRDTALIQYMDNYQAKLAKLYLNGCPFGNGRIKVNTSKSQYIIMPKKGTNTDSEE